MQLGINCFGIKWSPVVLKYPNYSGLYEKDNRFLYVNRGFGYLGFPGRVGTAPEITVIILKSK
jgi:predicted MPP superfamily phosphohydrolase